MTAHEIKLEFEEGPTDTYETPVPEQSNIKQEFFVSDDLLEPLETNMKVLKPKKKRPRRRKTHIGKRLKPKQKPKARPPKIKIEPGDPEPQIKNRIYKTSTHINHFGEKVLTFDCEECTKTFKVRNDLRFHINRSHFTGRVFSCTRCTKVYRSEKYLLEHESIMHTKAIVFRCDVPGCTREFVNENMLEKHKEWHSSEFECPTCSHRFSEKKFLHRHLRNTACKYKQASTQKVTILSESSESESIEEERDPFADL